MLPGLDRPLELGATEPREARSLKLGEGDSKGTQNGAVRGLWERMWGASRGLERPQMLFHC